MVSLLSNTAPHRAGSLRASAAALAAILTGGAWAQCQYSVTAVIESPPCPFGLPSITIGTGMNHHGDVVGRYRDCLASTIYYGFLWTSEDGFTPLPHPADVHTARANDINDHGLVVGNQLFTGDGDMPIGWRGFVYDIATGEYTYLEPKYEGGSSWANAINNAGIVAGSRTIDPDGGQSPFNAVIWDTTTGEVTDLGVMNGPNSTARDINASGDVTGWTGVSITSKVEGFAYVNHQLSIFGAVPDGETSRARAIDGSGNVLGSGHVTDDSGTTIKAFHWQDDWLFVIDPPEGFDHIGGGNINNVGQSVLTATVSGSAGPDQPFLWQHQALHNLTSLMIGNPSVSLRSAQGMNDAGQILTRGIVNGQNVGVVLTPADQPLGDLNNDCTVGIHDLLLLIANWGPCADPENCPADFTGDGTVGVADLLILIANWTSG